jgi:hypothetical protein
MGKMFNALVMSGIISIVLLLFDGSGILGVIAQLFVAPPTNWGSFVTNAFIASLGGLTVLGASAIIVGSVLIKMDWLVRAGMFTVLLSWVEAPFIQMWTFLGSKLNATQIGSQSLLANGATSLGMVFTGIIIGPMILYAMWACIQYIWGDYQ